MNIDLMIGMENFSMNIKLVRGKEGSEEIVIDLAAWKLLPEIKMRNSEGKY